MDSPFSVLSLKVVQIGLPLVANHFATGETSYGDDHLLKFDIALLPAVDA